MKTISRYLGAFAAVAISATALTACDSGPVYGAYCVDRYTQLRVSDFRCNDSSNYLWYYVPAGQSIPSIGGRSFNGSTSTPTNGSVYRGGLPTTSGKAPSKAPSGATKYTPSSKPKVNTTKGGTTYKPKAPAPAKPKVK